MFTHKLNYKFFFTLIIFFILLLTPPITITVIKAGASSTVSGIRYLVYDVNVSGVLQSAVNARILAVTQSNFEIFLTVNNGKISFNGNSHGLSARGMKELIFAYDPTYPDDPINANLSEPSTDNLILHGVYNKIYGGFSTVTLSYLHTIPYKGKLPPGISGPVITGMISGSIYLGKLNDGTIMYCTNIGASIFGNKTSLKSLAQTLNPSIVTFFGGKNMLNLLISECNSTGYYRILDGASFTLVSGNVAFIPVIMSYIEAALMTSFIPLLFFGLYELGVRRHWTPTQRMILPLISLVITWLFILSHTYILYIP